MDERSEAAGRSILRSTICISRLFKKQPPLASLQKIHFFIIYLLFFKEYAYLGISVKIVFNCMKNNNKYIYIYKKSSHRVVTCYKIWAGAFNVKISTNIDTYGRQILSNVSLFLKCLCYNRVSEESVTLYFLREIPTLQRCFERISITLWSCTVVKTTGKL